MGGVKSVASSVMPVLFIGHGSPENALRDIPLTGFWARWMTLLPAPSAIVVVSAHWVTDGIRVTSGEKPATIHDFYGFQEALHRLEYPAPGHALLARKVADALRRVGLHAELDPDRGLDHGVWVPLMRMHPEARLPVVQVSLPREPALLSVMGRALGALSADRVLVIGSGAAVHNLKLAEFGKVDPPAPAWARSFDRWVADCLAIGQHRDLERFTELREDATTAHPTREHFDPLLVAAAAGAGRTVIHAFEGFEHGTLSQRCVVWR